MTYPIRLDSQIEGDSVRHHYPIRMSLDGFYRKDWNRHVLVLKAYFDDSGTHAGSPAVIWAGFMAHVDEWTDLEHEWSALLQREGLTHMHMADLANSRGQFDLWGEARRDALTHEFRQIIQARNIIGIGAVVRTDAWAEVVAGTWLEKRLHSPVLFAFEHAIQQALHWAQAADLQTGISEKIDFVFDLREQDAAKGLDLANRYGEAGPWAPWFKSAIFLRMREAIPLQAADMLAFETYRLEASRRSGAGAGADKLRAHMKALLEGVPIYGQYYDADALRILEGQIAQVERPDLLAPHQTPPPPPW